MPIPAGVEAVIARYTPGGRCCFATLNAARTRCVATSVSPYQRRWFRRSPVLPLDAAEADEDDSIRFMILPNKKGIFICAFVMECTESINRCDKPALLPVTEAAPTRLSQKAGLSRHPNVSPVASRLRVRAAAFTSRTLLLWCGGPLARSPFMEPPLHRAGVHPRRLRSAFNRVAAVPWLSRRSPKSEAGPLVCAYAWRNRGRQWLHRRGISGSRHVRGWG
ncbi:hypothetical protein SPMU_24000 [Sphingomonas mucosissima]|uniref:Uncharacterized protein n=1 Tax=Sphingomonas mucosissima TaxID=370959 RepID=A0A245ZJQ5_9SPHN|nr:hypothetical protein SPMU_24000 [Sphingomonas mucosissima]